MHFLERWADKRLRMATIGRIQEDDNIARFQWIDKGSLIQRVTEKLMADDTSLLIIGRWRKLQRDIDYGVCWMVRDGWFQWPIIILWRVSLALYYVGLGLRYALRALLGRGA